MSIEGIALKHFSAAPQTNLNSNTPSRQLHAVFHSFLSYDSKQDASTITAHSTRLISFLKENNYYNIIEYNMGKH